MMGKTELSIINYGKDFVKKYPDLEGFIISFKSKRNPILMG